MREIENTALANAKIELRLQVRVDNEVAIRFYRQLGYRQSRLTTHYYEDGVDAWHMRKWLRAGDGRRDAPPYYAQTTDFTCGPAAVMMALAAIEPHRVLDQSLELKLWREATTVFMAGGHGGCEPIGLALTLASTRFPSNSLCEPTGALFCKKRLKIAHTAMRCVAFKSTTSKKPKKQHFPSLSSL